jgi:arylsulfatase A-like enzyme/Tfp pilus assembly protein PilF
VTIVAAVVALALAAGVAVWQRRPVGTPASVAAPATPPSILLVTLDTTRADRLGSYGYADADTPNLDRLARDGVRFERALSPVPLTLPAHASLMTGRHPFSHGVRNNGHFILPDDVPTLAALLSSRGYDTAAFVSSFVLDRQFGLARGFARYDDGLDEAPVGTATPLESERRGDRTLAAAESWLREPDRAQGGRPYFLWVHLYDPHEPYAPPPPFREQFAGRPYDGEIAFDDALVGRLLAASGYGSGTSPLVVVAGDHGESLGEHGESTHGLFVYEAALRVPLIVSWPGVLAPAVVTQPARLVDLAPTIADLGGAGTLQGAEGQTLRPLLMGRGDGDEPPPAYAETYFPQYFMQWAPLRAIEAGRWKYIDAPEPELYDMQADRAEQRNLVGEEPARAASLKRALEGMTGAGTGRQASTPLTAEARERLASLGYLSAAAPKPVEATASLPDPKRMVPLYEQLLQGNRALAEGKPAVAAGLARAVLAKDRGNAFAQLVLGRAALAAGQHREAIDALKAYASAVPGSADAHHWMALAYLRMGDRARALAEEEAALAIDPRLHAALALKAGLLFSDGRRDEGLRVLRDAVQREPDDTALRTELADLLTDARQLQDAEGEYRKVLAARPRDTRALLGLGLVLGASGRTAAALEPLTQAVEAEPGNSEARFARAEILESLGRLSEARADFARVAKETDRQDLRQIATRRAGKE